jgi:histidinol-phosphate phosphatase family protein
MSFDVVIPTSGRRTLDDLLAALARGSGPLPEHVYVVDDRPRPERRLVVTVPAALSGRFTVLRGVTRGPAAARNLGWRAGQSPWVAFLDDDVLPQPDWRDALARDLRDADGASGSQGRIRVTLPRGRPATDAERVVSGLENAAWATADLAYRRDSLVRVGGFDERFPRAYREDSDLGLRITDAGGWIVRGTRWVEHPAPAADWWAPVRRQRGNADDALMLALHGPGWQRRAARPAGARRRQLASSACLAIAVGSLVRGRRAVAAGGFAGWLALTASLTARRAAAGPRTPGEIARVAITSAAIEVAATRWWIEGLVRARRLTRRPQAVLLDRDGTLIDDVPYNGNPAGVRLRPGAREALDRLRAHGVRIAMVTNQSGVGRGLISIDQVGAVNRRVEELAGPLDGWFVCVHAPDEQCACRKPQPGLILEAARVLDVDVRRCAVIGDIEADMVAARRAGARGVLVPNASTRPDEVVRAEEVAPTLRQAVSRLLGPS